MVIFYHISKCAGTYLYNLFFERMNYISITPDINSEKKNTPKITINMNVNPGRFIEFIHYHQIPCPNRTENHNYWFTFIRHPVDRFISAFNHFKFISKDIEFANDLTNIEPDLKNALENDINNYVNIYYRSGAKFLTKNDYLEINFEQFDFIGFAENIEKDLNFLSDKFNLTKDFIPEWTNGCSFHGYKKDVPTPENLTRLERMLEKDISVWRGLWDAKK